MKKTTIFISIIVILVLGYFIFVSGGKNVNSQSSGNTGTAGEVQKVSISMKNGNYYPNTINVKQGTPVEITLDSSVAGCYRSFVIRDFGVNQYSANPSNKITFTPDKTGTFPFMCGMGMGRGTLIVE